MISTRHSHYNLRCGRASAMHLFRGRSSFATRRYPILSHVAQLSMVTPQPSPRPRASLSQLPVFNFQQQHRFMASDNPELPQKDPSPFEEIADDLKLFNLSKWGWVIYRTTYGDDEAWERFKVLVTRQCRKYLQKPDTPPSVAGALDWVFVSDKALDGASRDTLREHFLAWVAEAKTRESLGPPSPLVAKMELEAVRYMYFIQVDEESLRSVVDNPNGRGHVNLVRCWKGWDFDLIPAVKLDHKEFLKDPANYGQDLDDYLQNWFRLDTSSIDPDTYATLLANDEFWYMVYRGRVLAPST